MGAKPESTSEAPAMSTNAETVSRVACATVPSRGKYTSVSSSAGSNAATPSAADLEAKPEVLVEQLGLSALRLA